MPVAKLIRFVVFVLLLAAWIPGHAQEATTEAAPAPLAQADGALEANAPIALVDIAERADVDEGFAQATRLQAQSIDVVADLRPRLDEIRASVLIKQGTSRNMNLRAVPIVRLESLSRYWGFDARQFRRWKADYRTASEPLTAAADQISRRIAAWEATRAALPVGSLPAALSARIDVVTQELNAARQTLSAPISEQIALGRSANRLELEIQSGQETVGRAIAYIDKRLLRVDAPPLWRAGGGKASAGSNVAIDQAMAMETRFLHQYVAANLPNQRALQAMQLLLLPLLLWLAWRVRARAGAGVVEDNSTRPLRRPIASWILLAMIGVLVFEPDAPMLQVQLAIAMTLVPVLRLLPGDMRKRLGWWPHLAVALYLLLRLATVPLAGTDWYRWSLLGFALVVMAATLGLWWQLRRKTRAAGPGTLERVVMVAGWVVVGVLAVSVVANAVGNVSLAEMLVIGVVESGYMALLVYAAYAVFSALLEEVFASRFAAPLGQAQVGGTTLLGLLLRLLAIAAVIGWLVFAMQEFRVFRPVFEALRDVFTHQVSYGQLSLSLGDVAVFVVAVFLAFWIASLVKVLLHEQVLPRMALADGVDHSIAALTYYAVLMVGLLGALSAAGFKLSQLRCCSVRWASASAWACRTWSRTSYPG